MLFTIYYICTFLSPSLKAACFLKKIRLKKFAFSIYQQFPKMMSMDSYTRQASQTAHGDCKSRIKLPRIIRISPDQHRQFRVEPPVYDHPTACPTSATCARGWWSPTGESNCRRSFSWRGEYIHLLFGENIRTVSWGYNIGKSMSCSTQTHRLDHYIRCLLKRGFL